MTPPDARLSIEKRETGKTYALMLLSVIRWARETVSSTLDKIQDRLTGLRAMVSVNGGNGRFGFGQRATLGRYYREAPSRTLASEQPHDLYLHDSVRWTGVGRGGGWP